MAVKDQQQGPPIREIPPGHEFDKRALKPLSKALWSMTVALGHALTAHRHLSRLKSTTVSPDGHLGGRGYVMSLADIRKGVHEAAELLSTISDTLYDEVQAEHWKSELKKLDPKTRKDVDKLIDEAGEALEDPEGEVKDDVPKTASHPLYTETSGFDVRSIFANSSLPVGEMPGGPRVEHIGPGEGPGLYGEWNRDTDVVDDWSADGGGQSRRDDSGEDYDYPSPWENITGASEVPDYTTESTPTEGRDFGLGFGARGQGTQYGNPSGEGNGTKGVYGPQSGLPGSPGQSSGDSIGETVDYLLNERQKAAFALYGAAALPQDSAGPVSRSDYYEGPKDNMVSVGTSELPEAQRIPSTGGQPLVNTYYTQEDSGTGYVRWDSTTKTLREPSGDHPGQDHQEPWAPYGEATR